MPLNIIQAPDEGATFIESHPTRPFLLVHTQQRSPDWFAHRLGRVTGSVAGAVWNRTQKGTKTAEWKKLQDRLLAEVLTGISQDDAFTTWDMQRGIDLEPVARAELERRIGFRIQESGFLAHTQLRAGSSLDGHIGDFDAVVEIKCPRTTTHLQYIEERGLPDTYMGQLLHNLYISGAERLYFASYDDRLPQNLRLMVVERKASDMPLEEYGQRLAEFLGELEQRIEALSTGEILPIF